MLTLEAILKTTRQMTAYGERGTMGALDHLPQRVQGPREKKVGSRVVAPSTERVDPYERKWDDKTNSYVYIMSKDAS